MSCVPFLLRRRTSLGVVPDRSRRSRQAFEISIGTNRSQLLEISQKYRSLANIAVIEIGNSELAQKRVQPTSGKNRVIT